MLRPGSRPAPSSEGYEMGSAADDAETDASHVSVTVWPASSAIGSADLGAAMEGSGGDWARKMRIQMV